MDLSELLANKFRLCLRNQCIQSRKVILDAVFFFISYFLFSSYLSCCYHLVLCCLIYLYRATFPLSLFPFWIPLQNHVGIPRGPRVSDNMPFTIIGNKVHLMYSSTSLIHRQQNLYHLNSPSISIRQVISALPLLHPLTPTPPIYSFVSTSPSLLHIERLLKTCLPISERHIHFMLFSSHPCQSCYPIHFHASSISSLVTFPLLIELLHIYP